MSTGKNDIGVVGLGVMGRNLVLNIADHGFRVAVFNRTASVTREFASALEPGQNVQPCYSLEELVEALARPRRILMMVKDDLGGRINPDRSFSKPIDPDCWSRLNKGTASLGNMSSVFVYSCLVSIP